MIHDGYKELDILIISTGFAIETNGTNQFKVNKRGKDDSKAQSLIWYTLEDGQLIWVK